MSTSTLQILAFYLNQLSSEARGVLKKDLTDWERGRLIRLCLPSIKATVLDDSDINIATANIKQNDRAVTVTISKVSITWKVGIKPTAMADKTEIKKLVAYTFFEEFVDANSFVKEDGNFVVYFEDEVGLLFSLWACLTSSRKPCLEDDRGKKVAFVFETGFSLFST